MPESAWLIERESISQPGRVQWLSGGPHMMGDDWTHESLRAIRFSRQQDAEALISWLNTHLPGYIKPLRATEHIWG